MDTKTATQAMASGTTVRGTTSYGKVYEGKIYNSYSVATFYGGRKERVSPWNAPAGSPVFFTVEIVVDAARGLVSGVDFAPEQLELV